MQLFILIQADLSLTETGQISQHGLPMALKITFFEFCHLIQVYSYSVQYAAV